MNLTRNFRTEEFVDASHDGCQPSSPWGRERWWSESILQPLRNAFGTPIRITSYNRCIPGRIGAGGHGLGGEAIDIVPLNVTNVVDTMREMVEWLATYKPEFLGKVLLEISPPHLHMTTKGPEPFRAENTFQALEETASGDWIMLRGSETVTDIETAVASAEREKDGTISQTFSEPKLAGVGSSDLSPNQRRIFVLGSLGFVGGLVLAKVV